MVKEIRQGVLFTVITMLLLGGVYHVVLWGVGRLVFPAYAEGSLIRREDGGVIGSRLVAQEFDRPEYFHPRPSAVNYNAASMGGSNYAPSNPDHLEIVQQRVAAITTEDGVSPEQIPSEMVTAGGAGLDPHIPPRAAVLQAPRVARSRRIPADTVEDLIAAYTEAPALGLLGRARVNVLELNVALDDRFGTPGPAGDATSTDGR